MSEAATTVTVAMSVAAAATEARELAVVYTVKWAGKELSVGFTEGEFAAATMAVLRLRLYVMSRVLPERQKFLGLTVGGKPVAADDVSGAV